jgi:hypothetical protein
MKLRRACAFSFAAAISLIAVASMSACADADLTVSYAKGYHRGQKAISFLGVFKDGRLNSEVWDGVDDTLAHALPGYPCQALYSAQLLSGDSDLSSAIDSYVRADGVSDDLLDKLAPMAKGDLIVVVTVAGRPPKTLDGGASTPAPSTNPRGGGGRRGRSPSGASPGVQTDRNVFELAATLYSIKDKTSVGLISMSYTGPSAEDAWTKFRDRFVAEMAGSSCRGWDLEKDPKVDGAQIRSMIDR